MTCTASLNPNVASQLIDYLVLDWVRTDGQIFHQTDRVTIEQQHISSSSVTRSLTFDTLNMTHGGEYKCEAKLILPGSAGSFNTTVHHDLHVLS